MRGCAPILVVCACAFRVFVSISFDTVHYPWSRRAHFEGARRQELCHPYADSAEGDSVAARRTRSVRHCADGHWQDRGLCVDCAPLLPPKSQATTPRKLTQACIFPHPRTYGAACREFSRIWTLHRSEEHQTDVHSLMRTSYAALCFKTTSANQNMT